jgi:hypothetical protein
MLPTYLHRLQHLRVACSSPVPLLNACHIVPWAVSHDDTLPNRRSAKLTV